MLSASKFRQHADAPLLGAMLGLLILATAWILGLPPALGFERPFSIPCAVVLGAIVGRWRLTPLYVATALMMLVAAVGIWSPIVPRLATPFVRNDRVELDSVDAIFVFSNAVNTHGLVAGEGIDRLLTGIMLRARRPVLPLVVSVVRSTERQKGVSSVADQRALISISPASGPVEWIDSVYSTRDEAVRLSRIAFLQRWKRVATVTSPLHTRRACATVEAMGLPVTCVAAPWRRAGWPARTTADRIVAMQSLTYETLAWVQYRITGWANWS